MSTFQFKELTIQQKSAAMKVGTDSILLGSWVQLKNEESILDIGAGTGLLSLMLAQRSDAEIIDAVEIEPNAFEEAIGNFENSPWGDRLFCYHSSIQDFALEIEDKYDLIIANPPYFEPYKNKAISAKSTARQTQLLDYKTLLKSSKFLLSKTGTCAFIIPFDKEVYFIELAQNKGLFPQRITHIKDTKTAKYKRSLLQFGLEKAGYDTTILILKNENKSYSKDFIALTKDFYLNF